MSKLDRIERIVGELQQLVGGADPLFTAQVVYSDSPPPQPVSSGFHIVIDLSEPAAALALPQFNQGGNS